MDDWKNEYTNKNCWIDLGWKWFPLWKSKKDFHVIIDMPKWCFKVFSIECLWVSNRCNKEDGRITCTLWDDRFCGG